jgi:hypothetical protein
MHEPLLTPADVERLYGITVRQQRMWKCRGKYGWAELTIKLGGAVRYERKDIEAWLASRKGGRS